METMSALDSAFLEIEDRHAALHIGSVGVFEGPVPPFAAIRDELGSKLPRVPRYRQRMVRVPGNLGRPTWQDDPEFDLDYHLRRTALPEPGGDIQLQDLVGRIMSQPLDHDRPLWEDWVVEGLSGGRWALVTKVHHSMVDGIAGTDLLTTFFGATADPGAGAPADAADRTPRTAAGRRSLVARALRDGAAVIPTAVRAAAAALSDPRSLVVVAGSSSAGLLRYLGAARPVSRSSLLGPLGTARRYRWAEVPLQDVLDVRAAFGCTVNDVVLTAVTLAYQELLLGRGENLSAHAIRTLVPVSVRRPDQRGAFDNRVSAILLELPFDETDPLVVLEIVAERMKMLKSSHEAEAGELVTSLGNSIPPAGLALGLKLAFRVPQRFLTTVTTNVPGPREELHLGGRRMLAAYPYVPIADRVRTGIAVTSYAGNLLFGITADWDSTPDVDRLRDALVEALTDLTRCAHEKVSHQ
jgi:diacylglycerol O-acyltransferase / wax synthase